MPKEILSYPDLANWPDAKYRRTYIVSHHTMSLLKVIIVTNILHEHVQLYHN